MSARSGSGVLPGIAGAAGAVYLRAVRRTLRLRREGAEQALPADGGPVIYCFWHEQLAMMPWMQFRPPTVVPISRSSDGDITSSLFGRLGVIAVRGSSSRGGAVAARGLIRAIRGGSDAGITPDGPKGPARVVQPGAAWIARATGRPLLPVAFASTRVYRLRTWDRMLLPLPFGRGVFCFGEHIWLARDADDSALARGEATLARRLDNLSDRAASSLLT